MGPQLPVVLKHAAVGEVWEWVNETLFLILVVHKPSSDDDHEGFRYDALNLLTGEYEDKMSYTIGVDDGWKRIT